MTSDRLPTTEEIRERFADGFPMDRWAVLALTARVEVAESKIARALACHEPTFVPKHNRRAESCTERVAGLAWLEACDVCDGRVARCACGQPYPCSTVRALAEGSE